jgi:hypothetical protein
MSENSPNLVTLIRRENLILADFGIFIENVGCFSGVLFFCFISLTFDHAQDQ